MTQPHVLVSGTYQPVAVGAVTYWVFLKIRRRKVNPWPQPPGPTTVEHTKPRLLDWQGVHRWIWSLTAEVPFEQLEGIDPPEPFLWDTQRKVWLPLDLDRMDPDHPVILSTRERYRPTQSYWETLKAARRAERLARRDERRERR